VICGEDGISVFDRLRYGRQPQSEAVLFAFDLLELVGKDLRRTPLEERKGTLAKLVRKSSWAVQLNEHIAERGDIVSQTLPGAHCVMGCVLCGASIVRGRAVKREAEEDWGR
jgi:bifunctional non-homologous end joining protein LigD